MTQQQSSETEVRHAPRQLGTLESQLMEILWSTPAQLTVQEVVDRLGDGHNYKTVMTVLNRLVEKDLLERQLDGRAYRYRPHLTRDQFLRSIADDLVHGYLQTYGEESSAHITQAVDAVLPRRSAPSMPPPPPPPLYYDEEEKRTNLLPIILVAIALEALVLFLLRRR